MRQKPSSIGWALISCVGGVLLIAGCAREELVHRVPYSIARAERPEKTYALPAPDAEDEDRQEEATGKNGIVPITLQESIETALRNNPQVSLADREILIAQARIHQAFSSFLPTVTGGYNFTTMNKQRAFEAPGGISFASGQRDVENINATLRGPTFDFGVTGNTYRSSKLSKDIAALAAKRTYQDIVLDVTRAYFGILREQSFEEVLWKSREQLAEQARVANDFFVEGLVAKNDVLFAEVRLASVEQDLIRAQNNTNVAKAIFNRILDRSVDTPTEVLDILEIEPFNLAYAETVRLAIEHRPELHRVKKEIERARRELAAAKGRRLPRAFFLGTYDYTSDTFQAENDILQYGVYAEIDAFTGGRLSAEQEEASHLVDLNLDQQRKIEAGVLLDVKTAFLRSEEAAKRIVVARKAIEQAEENHRIVSDQYEERIMPMTDVLAAETALTRARFDYFRAMVDYNLAIAELDNAMGHPAVAASVANPGKNGNLEGEKSDVTD